MSTANTTRLDPAYRRHLALLMTGDQAMTAALWSNQVGFWRMDVERDEITWSNDWCTRLNLDPCAGPGHVARWNARVHPNDLAGTYGYERLADRQTQLYEAEFRVRTLAGTWLWVQSRGCVAEINARGEPSVIVGMTVDIDARKRAQLALEESENRLSLAVWGGALGLWDWDIVADRCSWLNDWWRSCDFDDCSGAAHAQQWNNSSHPEDRARIELIDAECHDGRRDSYEYEYRHRTVKGDWRWLLERGRVAARAPDGRATRITGVCMDITQRKHNERKLHDYQERYFAVVQRVPGYVFEMRPSADGLANVSWASDGLTAVFGCDLDTYHALGGWRHFWFPEDFDRNIDNLRALLRGEATEQHWRVRNIHGEERWLHEFYTPFVDPANGKVDTILGVAHDVTSRIQLERKLLSAAQQEQQRIASDLHDGLGQELTSIAIVLQDIVPRLEGLAPDESRELTDAITLVRDAIANTRAIAHGLAPVPARPGALPSALRALAHRVSRSGALKVDVRETGAVQAPLSVDLATQLYRIAQEALTNAVRHSGARRIEIALDLSGARSTLSISDDGVGMTASARNGNGLGLGTMAFRAELIGATLDVAHVSPHGTRVTCSFPLP